MKAKFKVGDIVRTNDEYLRQGIKYFGWTKLKHKNFEGEIIKVYENTHNEKDGFGDIWQNVYVFKDDISICEVFLERA